MAQSETGFVQYWRNLNAMLTERGSPRNATHGEAWGSWKDGLSYTTAVQQIAMRAIAEPRNKKRKG